MPRRSVTRLAHVSASNACRIACTSVTIARDLALEADRAPDALGGVTRLPEGGERLHHREELAPAGVKPSALEVAERLVGEREEAVHFRLQDPRRSQRAHLRRLLAQEWQRQADG